MLLLFLSLSLIFSLSICGTPIETRLDKSIGKAFKRLDINNDGFLTIKEIEEFMGKKYNTTFDAEKFDRLEASFDKGDRNNDGRMDVNEFGRHIQNFLTDEDLVEKFTHFTKGTNKTTEVAPKN